MIWRFDIIDRYIGKTVLITTITIVMVLLSLSSVIKFADQLKNVGQGHYNIISVGIYTFLSIPRDIQTFFPMAVLLGTLLGLGNLAQRNELIIMQASGFTKMKISLSVIKTTSLLVIVMMIISEWIIPHSEEIARNYRIKKVYNCSSPFVKESLWVKDRNSFIYIERIKENKELIGISIYTFNKNRLLQSITFAESAKFDFNNKVWNLLQVHESNFENVEKINDVKLVSSTWKTNLTPNTLSLVRQDPDLLPINSLYNYIKYFKSIGQTIKRYQFHMWSKIFQPISVEIMVLMALSFIFKPLNNISMGRRIIFGISFGFLFYILNQVFEPLMLVCHISPFIGAILPSIIFLFISLRLLLHI